MGKKKFQWPKEPTWKELARPQIVSFGALPRDPDRDAPLVDVREARRTRDEIVLSSEFAIEISKQEIQGHLLPSRRPHRALIRIEEVEKRPDGEWFRVVVPAWNTREIVALPSALIPKAIRGKALRGRHLIGQVNIGAEAASDLYFTDLDLASDPDSKDGLA